MIEVNLLPGGTKRRGRRAAPGPALPRLGGVSVDRWTALAVVGWIVGPAAILWLFLGAGSRVEELTLAIEQAVQDSARYAKLIETQEQLRARRDSIAERLEIIQEIDAGRYIWPHIMDEVSRALPENTWLTSLQYMSSERSVPEFQIVGRTGHTFALTRFMTDLEASPYIRSVRINKTEQVRDEGERWVYEFILSARYEEPAPELIETVSIFANGGE